MSDRRSEATLRIVGGANTARLVVSTAGGPTEVVPDTRELAARKAREEGYRAGYEDAAAKARTELDAHREAVARLANRLPAAWDAELERLEDGLRAAVVELAFQIAEAVVRAPLHAPEAVRSAVSEALSLPLLEGGLTVRCHPADADALQASPRADARIRIHPDARLEPGDAWISTPDTGDLDGRLAGRLDILRQRMLELVAAPGPDREAAP